MKIPKQITLCGHTIKIEYRKGLVVDGTECWGVYDDEKHTIYLKEGMDKTREMEIFLHEAIHAIGEIHVLSFSEKTVKILGIEILGLIRNNKIKLLENEKSNNSRSGSQRKRRSK